MKDQLQEDTIVQAALAHDVLTTHTWQHPVFPHNMHCGHYTDTAE